MKQLKKRLLAICILLIVLGSGCSITSKTVVVSGNGFTKKNYYDVAGRNDKHNGAYRIQSRDNVNYLFYSKAGNQKRKAISLKRKHIRTIWKLSDNSDLSVSIDEKLAPLFEYWSQPLCKYIDDTLRCPRNFDYIFYVCMRHKQSTGSTRFYHALLLTSDVYPENSKLILLPDLKDFSIPTSDDIYCDTNKVKYNPSETDTLYASDGKGGIWKIPPSAKPSDTKAVDKPDAGKKQKAAADTVSYFNFSCEGNYNFTVSLQLAKDGSGTVSVHNNIDNAGTKNDTATIDVKIPKYDTLKQKKDAKILETISTALKQKPVVNEADLKEDSVSGKAYIVTTVRKIKDTSFAFTAYHEVFFTEWLNNKYKGLSRDCQNYLAYRVTEEIRRQDTAYIKCTLCKDISSAPASNTKADTGKVKVSAKMVKPGMITILNDTPISIHTYYSSTISRHETQETLLIKLNTPYSDSANQLVFIIDSGYLSNDPRINSQDTLITITEQDWKKALAGDSIIEIHLRISGNSMKDTLGSPQSTFIGVKGIPGQAQEVQLISYNPNKPFWIELGSNFDLLNGLQANNLYGGIFMHNKDVQRVFGGKKPNLSLFGGVYESKNISSEQSTVSSLQYLDNATFTNPPLPKDSTYVHRDTGTISKTTSITSLGIFFSPQLRLTSKPADQDGFHVFLSLWTEIVWQRVTTNFDYSKTANYRTYKIAVTDTTINHLNYKTTSFDADYRSHFLGLGLPMYLKAGNYNLYINPVFGVSTQVGISSDSEAFYSNKQVNQYWRGFYLVQFRLNEEQYGFAFTGEIRGVIATSGNYKPSISLALSKKFDLTKLIEFAK